MPKKIPNINFKEESKKLCETNAEFEEKYLSLHLYAFDMKLLSKDDCPFETVTKFYLVYK